MAVDSSTIGTPDACKAAARPGTGVLGTSATPPTDMLFILLLSLLGTLFVIVTVILGDPGFPAASSELVDGPVGW